MRFVVALVLPLSALAAQGCVGGSISTADQDGGLVGDGATEDDGSTGAASDARVDDASTDDSGEDGGDEDADVADVADAGDEDARVMDAGDGDDMDASVLEAGFDGTGADAVTPDALVENVPGLLATFDNGPLTTSENGAQFAFRVALRARPSSPVTVPVSVSNSQEASVLTPTLTFTPADWNGEKQVLIEGSNDDPPVKDGDVSYQVLLGPAQSSDLTYDGLRADAVELVNLDDDTPGVLATADLAGLNDRLATTEAGGGARFWLTLRTRPRAAVTIPILSSNTAEGVVNVSAVTIAPARWDSVNWVEVTGVDDAPPRVDGNVRYQVQFGLTKSDDPDYDGLRPAPVEVTNEDNDSAALVLTAQQTPLLTTESGTLQQWIDVRLLTQPSAPVRVPVQSSAPEEALPALAELVFDPSSWSAAQRVSVAGIPDFVADGLQPYDIRFGPTVSTDARYVALSGSVPGTNYDIDSPNILITYDSALKTSELGSQTAFSMVLTKAPTADVTVPLQVLPSAQGTSQQRYEGALVAPASLVFTPTNYNSIRRVVVTGADDALVDGDQQYFVQVGPAASADPNYAGRTLPNLALINEDDDSAGLVVDLVGPLDNDRLRLSEPGPGHAEFTVRLATQPAAAVTVTFVSSDPSEGTAPGPLVFVPSAPGAGQSLWSAAQTVSVQVVDDTVQDGPVDFRIRAHVSSSDPAYDTAGLDELILVRTYDDSDSAGLLVTPTLLPPDHLDVTEPGGTDTFTVQLSSMPTSAVTVPIVGTDPSEGALTEGSFVISAAGITIQPESWNVPRIITLKSVRDDIDDGDQSYLIKLGPTTSLDRLYQNKTKTINAVTHDADSAGIIFEDVTLPPAYSVVTREGGLPDDASVRLRLTSRPTAPVLLDVSIQGPDADEATVTPRTLTFTDLDWDRPSAHVIRVSAVDDAIDDGDREYTIVFAPARSSDVSYAGKTPLPATLRGLNADDSDASGVLVRGGPLALFEQGTSQNLSVSLRSQPTAPVTVELRMSGADPAGATLRNGAAAASRVPLVFSATNWSTPVVVVATGVSDLRRNGHRNVAVAFTLTSADTNYHALVVPDVTGQVFDVPQSCKSALALWPQTATGTGDYEIDTDLDASTPWHFAHCDMETDGGGWTLLAYSGDTDAYGGVPYPGHGTGAPYCLTGAVSTATCTRASGLPREDLAGLFATAVELAQGQTTTTSMLQNPYAERLLDYDFAGRYYYGSALGALRLEYAAATCTSFAQGTYFNISGTAARDATIVYLARALRSALPSNYSSIDNSYTWSIGNPGGACTLSDSPPASKLGTWQAAQSGPQIQAGSGSYSVWIR